MSAEAQEALLAACSQRGLSGRALASLVDQVPVGDPYLLARATGALATQQYLTGEQIEYLAGRLSVSWRFNGDNVALRDAAAALVAHHRAVDHRIVGLIGLDLLPSDLRRAAGELFPSSAAIAVSVLEDARHPLAGAVAEIRADYRHGVHQIASLTLLSSQAAALRTRAVEADLDPFDVAATMVVLVDTWTATSAELLPTAIAILTAHGSAAAPR